MKMTIFVVVIVAMILFYAIHLGRGVKLEVRLPGTDASLEITDRGRPPAARGERLAHNRRSGARPRRRRRAISGPKPATAGATAAAPGKGYRPDSCGNTR